MSNKIIVIGLGSMGSALAIALLKNDYEVTVWNRTASKAAPLLKAGAIQAGSVAEGVGANNLIAICVSNYDDTTLLLEGCGDLSGKTFIRLTTASASEAKVMEAWAIRKGGLWGRRGLSCDQGDEGWNSSNHLAPIAYRRVIRKGGLPCG